MGPREGQGPFYLIESGNGDDCMRIKSELECKAAAEQLNLADITVQDDRQSHPHGKPYDPPYCYLEAGSLKFNPDGANSGPCHSWDKCICGGGVEKYCSENSAGELEEPLTGEEQCKQHLQKMGIPLWNGNSWNSGNWVWTNPSFIVKGCYYYKTQQSNNGLKKYAGYGFYNAAADAGDKLLPIPSIYSHLARPAFMDQCIGETTFAPTNSPTNSPTTKSPTKSPTSSPTTKSPTKSPTLAPTTKSPTKSPTHSPTNSPTTPCDAANVEWPRGCNPCTCETWTPADWCTCFANEVVEDAFENPNNDLYDYLSGDNFGICKDDGSLTQCD